MRYRVVALVCWLAVLLGGVALLAAHQFTPGGSGPAPNRWPEPGPAGRVRLVMFIHPRCPCAPASLQNFGRVVAAGDCEAVVYVAADDPDGSPNGRAAACIPGAVCRPDPEGRAAARFGAATSGHVFLYDRRGRLTFEGGVTDGRGHAGDNPGLRAAMARLLEPDDAFASFPVFGCPLFERSFTGGAP